MAPFDLAESHVRLERGVLVPALDLIALHGMS